MGDGRRDAADFPSAHAIHGSIHIGTPAMNRYLASAFAAASAARPGPAVATTPQWTALIALDDGGLDPQMIPVVADSEMHCLAALSSYRDVVVIEPCQPVSTASAITDPNDANRTSKTPKPKQPGEVDSGWGAGSAAGSGVGTAGGGMGGG